MTRRRLIPIWLRRGIEAGVPGALLSAGTFVAFEASRPAPRLTLPHGLDGAMILLPAVLALGVLAIAYPIALAATRQEAWLGAAAAFLIAADVLMIISLVRPESILLRIVPRSVPLGIVALGLALPVAFVASLAGQLSPTPGFGRSSGLRSVVAGSVATVLVVLAGAYFL